MALEEELQSIPEDLDLPILESDNPESPMGDSGESETEAIRFTDVLNIFKEPGERRFGLIFAAGLLLGWLVIGWWLWPVQWINTDPWHLRRKYRKTYVSLVAENFWWTKDVRQAQEALAGWDDEELAELLVAMQREAASPDERQQLAALARALEIPIPKESLWHAVLGRKAIFLSSALSAMPLTAAIALAVYSFAQERTRLREQRLIEEEQLTKSIEEELLEEEEEERRKREGAALGGGMGEEEDEELLSDAYDAEEDFYAQQEALRDLASLSLDEDTDFTYLENLCERLPDVDTSDLLEDAIRLASQLRRGNALRAGGSAV